YLVEASGQELLSSEARVYRHHHHVVQFGCDLLHAHERCRGIQGDTRLEAALAQVGDRPLQVGQRLDVQADPVRACVGESVDVKVGVLDHEVHVQGEPGR